MKSGEYSNILVERRGAVGIVTLNRPQALNALNAALIAEVGTAFDELEGDPAIGAIVLTGGEKAFAAGADIKEMADKTYMQAYAEDFITTGWERVAQCRKPVVAAVGGFALGGGCEVAMMVKEAVNRAFETTLAEGVRFERRLFHSTFATEDQKEGMAAFIAKRKPDFKNR